MSITQLVQEKMCIYCENQRFRFRIEYWHVTFMTPFLWTYTLS